MPRPRRAAPAGPFMSTVECARYLSVSIDTLRRWRSKGTGPPAHFGPGGYRYSVPEVDSWRASQPVNPRAGALEQARAAKAEKAAKRPAPAKRSTSKGRRPA